MKPSNGLPAPIAGALAGFIATGPMTVAMVALERALPRRERSPLPPATLSLESAERVLGEGVARGARPSSQATLAVASHFAMGTAAGLLYSATARKLPGPALAKGVVYGAAFWAMNYVGVSPFLGFRAAAPRMPARRNGMMFAAHLVFGAALAYLDDEFRTHGEEIWAGERKARAAE